MKDSCIYWCFTYWKKKRIFHSFVIIYHSRKSLRRFFFFSWWWVIIIQKRRYIQRTKTFFLSCSNSHQKKKERTTINVACERFQVQIILRGKYAFWIHSLSLCDKKIINKYCFKVYYKAYECSRFYVLISVPPTQYARNHCKHWVHLIFSYFFIIWRGDMWLGNTVCSHHWNFIWLLLLMRLHEYSYT